VEVGDTAGNGDGGAVLWPAIGPGEGVYVSNAGETGMGPGASCSAVEL